MLVMILIALMVGTRYHVGYDWNSYRFIFWDAQHSSLAKSLVYGDSGYQALNWAVSHLGGKIWAVNLVCGAVFSWGLYRFAVIQPEPWLAVLVAFPYLVVVIAMGYSRQGMAIGILLAGLASLSKKRSSARFIIYVVAAALFHRTAIVLFPLALFGSTRSRAINLFLIVILGVFLANFFLSESVDEYVKSYIIAEYSSQGAVIRVMMSVIPALIFFVSSDRMGLDDYERRIWRNLAVASMVALIGLFVVPSTTAIDRLALYILPLQIVVFSRMSVLTRGRLPAAIAVIFYSGLILYVWLNFADNANAWIPYRSYLWT